MNEFRKDLNDFIKEIKSIALNNAYTWNKARELSNYFNQNLKDKKHNMIKFHFGVGRSTFTPWIEITKKNNNVWIHFLCIIFSKKTKTPYITLQLPIYKNNKNALIKYKNNFQKELIKRNIFFQKSFMDLESEKNSRGYYYQYYADVYSQKFVDEKQIAEFLDVIKRINSDISSCSNEEINKINENKNQVYANNISSSYIEGKVKQINFAQISFKGWSDHLKSMHSKCIVCPYNYKKVLRVHQY